MRGTATFSKIGGQDFNASRTTCGRLLSQWGQVTLVNSSGGPPRGDCVEFEPLTLSLGAGSGDFPGGGGRCEVECTIDKHD